MAKYIIKFYIFLTNLSACICVLDFSTNIMDIITDIKRTEERRVWANNGVFYTHIKCAHCHDKRSKNDPCVLGREDCLTCLTNTSNCLKDLYVLECSFCSQDLKCASCAKCSCSDRCNFHVCCDSCNCDFKNAITKERRESRESPNKACERCFFCRSVSFYPSFDKCPQCCRLYSCRGQTAKFLASLGSKGFES